MLHQKLDPTGRPWRALEGALQHVEADDDRRKLSSGCELHFWERLLRCGGHRQTRGHPRRNRLGGHAQFEGAT